MAEAKVIEQPRPQGAGAAAKATSATSPKEQKQGKVVLVEVPKLSDIPKFMDALEWKVSAALMRKWFAASSHEMTKAEKLGEVAPSHYPPELVDTKTVTMQWILGFARAKEVVQSAMSLSFLGNYGFDIEEARMQLAKRIKRAGLFQIVPQPFGDLAQPALWQHEHWQFRLFRIDSSQYSRGKVLMSGMDDLFGALASFGIYLAAKGSVTPQTKTVDTGRACQVVATRYDIEITHIVLYARDTYDFIGDQYLGHWSKDGVEVVSSYVLQEKLGTLSHSDYVPSGEPPDVKLPVGNHSFNEFRKRQGKGGDLLIFSNTQVYALKRPIRFSLTAQQVAGLS